MKGSAKKVKRPALEKNPLIKDVKEHFSVVTYAEQSRALKKVSSSSKERILNDQKILANHMILTARVMHKVKGLSQADKKTADKLFQDMYTKIISRSATDVIYRKNAVNFLKEFANALDRKEGKEVLEIIKKASQAVYNI